jgi:ATP-dependent protease HslVU (ClpYQ) peptidase subunit
MEHMTCIVAVKVETGGTPRIVIGGDSAGVAGHDILIRKDPKVFRNSELLIGITSSFRMGQIMRFKFVPPAIPPGIDLYEYMVVHFVDRVRAAMKEGGFAEVQNSVERGGSFIVGLRERIFTIGSDFQVGENVDGFASVGSGADYALGALDTLRTLPHLSGEQMVEQALHTAAKFSGGVRPPFVILASETVQSLTESPSSVLEAPLQPPATELIAGNSRSSAAFEIAAEAPEP